MVIGRGGFDEKLCLKTLKCNLQNLVNLKFLLHIASFFGFATYVEGHFSVFECSIGNITADSLSCLLQVENSSI